MSLLQKLGKDDFGLGTQKAITIMDSWSIRWAARLRTLQVLVGPRGVLFEDSSQLYEVGLACTKNLPALSSLRLLILSITERSWKTLKPTMMYHTSNFTKMAHNDYVFSRSKVMRMESNRWMTAVAPQDQGNWNSLPHISSHYGIFLILLMLISLARSKLSIQRHVLSPRDSMTYQCRHNRHMIWIVKLQKMWRQQQHQKATPKADSMPEQSSIEVDDDFIGSSSNAL